jgi:non-ribosomal peptide synthetase component F
VQYADYAVWERNWFQGEVFKKHLSYWRDHLKGAPPVIDLPTDRPRPKVASDHGACEFIQFSPGLSAALKKLGLEEDTTLFMTLLAGFQSLLSRFSGREQVVVGTDVAGRTSAETERMAGFFVNLLALRTDLSGNPSFRETMRRVREVAFGAYAHQETPFDKVVEELQPERSLSCNPLVQVLFVMQNLPAVRRELAGLELSSFEAPITRSKFDLAVFMMERGEQLGGYWLYRTDLFDRATILRIAKQFETLLWCAVANPDARLNMLELYSAEEKQRREAEQKRRKQSQFQKLAGLAPKEVDFDAGMAQGD